MREQKSNENPAGLLLQTYPISAVYVQLITHLRQNDLCYYLFIFRSIQSSKFSLFM